LISFHDFALNAPIFSRRIVRWMLSIEANESMVYIGISNRGLEKVNGKKCSKYPSSYIL